MIYDLLRTRDANIRHRIEPKNLIKSNRRPADILIYGIGEFGLALDVGITDAISRFVTAMAKNKHSFTNGRYSMLQHIMNIN